MKKTLSVVLAVLMVVCAAPVASASDTTVCDHSDRSITIPAREPECELYGYTEQWECNKCSYVEKAKYIPGLVHEYKMVEGSQNADGVTYRCDKCMDSYVVAHRNWSTDMLSKKPTCTEQGWSNDRTCKDCGYHQVSQTIPATGHDYEVISADEISHTIRCKTCGDTMENDGHLYTIVFDEGFNCYSENATGSKVCTKCGYVAQSSIAIRKGEHPNMSSSVKTEYTLKTCKDCGYARLSAGKCANCKDTINQADNYSIYQPTCTENGYVMYKCSECSHADTVAVSATGHYQPGDYEYVVEPTCRSFGKKSKFCIRDGCGYSDDIVIPKRLHSTVATSESYDATCTEDGLAPATYCMMCNTFFPSVVIEATGHNIIDYNGEDFCTNCYKYMVKNEEGTVECDCLCHNHDGLAVTVFKILMFFCKIFGFMQSCDCGAVHYEK